LKVESFSKITVLKSRKKQNKAKQTVHFFNSMLHNKNARLATELDAAAVVHKQQ